MKDDEPCGGYSRTKTNLAGSEAGQTRAQMPVTASGAEGRFRYPALSYLSECLLRTPTVPEQLLGAAELVDNIALASFLGDCQFRFGGIAKAPEQHAGLYLSQSTMRVCSEKSLLRSIPHISISRGYRHVYTP